MRPITTFAKKAFSKVALWGLCLKSTSVNETIATVS